MAGCPRREREGEQTSLCLWSVETGTAPASTRNRRNSYGAPSCQIASGHPEIWIQRRQRGPSLVSSTVTPTAVRVSRSSSDSAYCLFRR